jgi:hypothetical protein
MHSNILRPNLNQKCNEYLSNCDLINKYSLKNTNNIPKIKKISLELDLKDFLLASEISEKNQKHILSQTKSYLLFYILFGFLPKINFNKNVVSKSKILTLSELHYSLSVVFSTKREVNNFLHSFFIENFSKLSSDGFKVFKKKEINNKVNSLNSFLLSIIIPGNSFNESDSFFKGGLNLKNLKFKLNISINNPKLKNNQNIVKNLPFFWING